MLTAKETSNISRQAVRYHTSDSSWRVEHRDGDRAELTRWELIHGIKFGTQPPVYTREGFCEPTTLAYLGTAVRRAGEGGWSVLKWRKWIRCDDRLRHAGSATPQKKGKHGIQARPHRSRSTAIVVASLSLGLNPSMWSNQGEGSKAMSGEHSLQRSLNTRVSSSLN